jgi:hypothetical protein
MPQAPPFNINNNNALLCKTVAEAVEEEAACGVQCEGGVHSAAMFEKWTLRRFSLRPSARRLALTPSWADLGAESRRLLIAPISLFPPSGLRPETGPVALR